MWDIILTVVKRVHCICFLSCAPGGATYRFSLFGVSHRRTTLRSEMSYKMTQDQFNKSMLDQLGHLNTVLEGLDKRLGSLEIIRPILVQLILG